MFSHQCKNTNLVVEYINCLLCLQYTNGFLNMAKAIKMKQIN